MSEVQASTALVAMVLNTGVSAEELAHAAGLDLRIVETPTLIPYDDGMRLWRAAAQLTGDPAVGLHAGMSCRVDRVPVLGTMFAHSDNLADALERLAQHLPQVIRGVRISFSREALGEFTYRAPGCARHGVDSMFAAIVQLARDCAGDSVRPTAVNFQSAAPDDRAPYVGFFGVRPRWGQAVCSMRFDAGALDAAFRGASPALVTLLESHTASLLDAGHSEQKAIEAVVQRAVLRCLRAEQPASIVAVAKRLGRSPRTLQRQIAQAGLTFRDVRDMALRTRADVLLASEDESVASIAGKLGFATRSSFERAYRRWTGRTPTDARKGAQPPGGQ